MRFRVRGCNTAVTENRTVAFGDYQSEERIVADLTSVHRLSVRQAVVRRAPTFGSVSRLDGCVAFVAHAVFEVISIKYADE